MDCSPPGFSVHGILQARIREWVTMPSSRGSSQPRDQICIFCSMNMHCRGVIYCWAIGEDPVSCTITYFISLYILAINQLCSNYVIFSLFGCTTLPVGSLFPNLDLSPCLLQRKHRCLTTGSPANSLTHRFKGKKAEAQRDCDLPIEKLTFPEFGSLSS